LCWQTLSGIIKENAVGITLNVRILTLLYWCENGPLLTQGAGRIQIGEVMLSSSAAVNILHRITIFRVKRWLNTRYFNVIFVPIDWSGPKFIETKNTRIAKLVCTDRSNLARPRERWTDQNRRRRKKPQVTYVVSLLLIITMLFKSPPLLLIHACW